MSKSKSARMDSSELNENKNNCPDAMYTSGNLLLIKELSFLRELVHCS